MENGNPKPLDLLTLVSFESKLNEALKEELPSLAAQHVTEVRDALAKHNKAMKVGEAGEPLAQKIGSFKTSRGDTIAVVVKSVVTREDNIEHVIGFTAYRGEVEDNVVLSSFAVRRDTWERLLTLMITSPEFLMEGWQDV